MAGNEMCSSLSLDDQEWKRVIKVLNVPAGVTTEDVEEFFEDEAIGGPIEMIYMMPNSSVAEITFENEADAIRVASHGKLDFKGAQVIVNRVNQACDVIMSTSCSFSSMRNDDGDLGSMSSSIVVLNDWDISECDKDSMAKKNDADLVHEDLVHEDTGVKMQQDKPKDVANDATAPSQGDSKPPVLKLGLEIRKVKEWLDTSDSKSTKSEESEVKTGPDTFGDMNEMEKSLDNQTDTKPDSLRYLNEDAPDDDDRTVHSTTESSSSNFFEDNQAAARGRCDTTSDIEDDHPAVKHRYQVFNIDEDLTEDEIVPYLESLAGLVKDVTEVCSNENSFIVQFENDPAGNIEMGEHEFMGSTFSVRPLEDELEEDTDSKSIVIMDIPSDVNEEMLRILFSSAKRGGGPVECIKVFSEENQRLAIVTFKDSSVASHLSEIGHFKIKKNEVKLIAHNTWSQRLENNLPRTPIVENAMQKSSISCESRRSQNISNNSKQRALDLEKAKLHEIECTVRITVASGRENMKIDTLERYAKKNGGEIAGRKKIDSDTFEFQFKFRKDAQKFLSRVHVLEDKTLIVQEIPSSEFVRGDAPMEDLEPKKILVRWTEGSTLTRDDLTFYLTEVTDSKEPKIRYVPKPNTAIVELDEPWDAETLRRRFKVNNLFDDGSVNVTATPLKIATCIALPGFNKDDPQKHALPYYFENPDKGGDKDCEVDLTGTVPIVRCPNGVVASRLASMKHKFGQKEYSAELVYEEVGVVPPDFNNNSPFLELPSDVEVDCKEELSAFFMGVMTLSYVNINLDSVHAEIDSSVKPRNGRLRIKCLLKKEMPDYQKLSLNWETKVNEVMANITDSLRVERFRPIDKTWDPLKETLNRMTLEDIESVRVLEMDDAKKEIKLIALCDDMKRLKKRIEKKIQDVTKDVESTDHEEEYKLLHLEYLRKNGELDKVKERFSVEIIPGSQSNCLKVTGLGKHILDATRHLRSTVEKLHEVDIDVSKNLGELLQTGSFVKKFLEKALGSTVLRVTGGKKVTLVGNKRQVDEAKTALKKSTKDSKVFFRSESKSLIGNAEWRRMLDSVGNIGRDKYKLNVNMAELRVELASLAEDAKTLKELLISFFETHTVWKERVALPEGKLQIVCSDFDQDVKSLPEKMNSKRASVRITSFDRQNGLILEGNKKELRQMRKEIDDILSKLHMHKETITGVGAKALGQEMAKHFRLSVERECKVHVEILNSDSSKRSYETTKNGVSVKVLVGSMDECPADVLVDPANEDLKHGGGLAKVLADAGGPIVNSDSLFSVKVWGKLKVGEVRTTSGGMLPCKVLYHTVGPQYKKEQNNYSFERELHHTTTACLDQAEKDGYQSIALPLISAGQFGGPIKVVAKGMGRAVADFVNSGAGTNLKEIIVIDYDQKKTEELASVLQGHFGGAIAKTPQRPMALSNASETSKQSGLKEDRIILSMDEMKQMKVDVIVNSVPQDGDLFQGPLSKSIMDCFGTKDQKIIQGQVKSQAPIGEFQFATSDASGLWRAIYHCRLGKWDGGKGTATRSLMDFIKKLLETASASEFQSIAIPAIGTGYLGFPHDVVASTMYQTVSQFMEKKPSGSLKKVVLVVHAKDDKSVQAFKKVLSGNYNGQSGGDAVIKGKVMIEQISFEVLEADITKETTECIVNGTNQWLDLAQGKVSQAIASAAGHSVVQECKKQGKVQGNGTFMSGAGNLKCRKICHLNVGHDSDNFKENIKTCLQEAENFHLKSISFPALGTGQYQKDPGQMASLTMEAIAEFTKNKPKHVKQIRVCIFDRKFLQVYHDEMQKVVVEGRKGSSWRKKVTGLKAKILGTAKETADDGQASISYSSVPVEKKVELCITYTQRQNRDKAIEMIIEFCQKQEKTTAIGGWKEEEYREAINNLDSFKEHNIKAEAKRLGIEIDIDKGRGKITLKGHESDVTEVFMKVKEILLTVRKQKDDDEKAKILADFVQWQFEHGGKFEAYPQDINLDIEKAYKKKEPCATWHEDRDGKLKKFTVNFKWMVEEDEKKNKIKVHRLAQDRKFELPKNWAPMSDKERFKLVQLSPSDTEYKDVEKAFRSTVPNLKISKIQRIQNKGLYQRYLVHKQQMENANEKLLWHGTGPDVVNNIIANGFNRSYCGVHGIKYGHGVYFAPRASYPVSFHQGNYNTPDANGDSSLFYNRVLVGDYTWGKAEYKEPPPKNPNDPTVRYDSCVNNMNRIEEYVIFKDTQCYPCYLIKYKVK